MRPKHTDERRNDRVYQESQEQRRLERDVRYAKQKAAMLEAAGDKEVFVKEALKIKEKQAKYNAFCKETGRTKRLDRTQVFEYNKSVSSKAVAAEIRVEKAKAEQEENKRLQELEREKQKQQKIAKIRELIKSDSTPKKLNTGSQNKHIPDSKGYIKGRSYLYGNVETAQNLVDRYTGTGELKFTKSTGEWNHKEIVTVDEDIGVAITKETGEGMPTNRFVIHYSKKGTHIVPTRRNNS